MRRNRLAVVCLLGILAAAGSAPTRARACGQEPGWARVVSAGPFGDPEPTPVPLGAGVLVELACLICQSDDDQATPSVEVVDAAGLPVPGAARWVDSSQGQPRYLLWEPLLPLAAGEYELRWTAPVTDFALSTSFVVGGAASDAVATPFEATLTTRSVEVGDMFACTFSSCGTQMVATQRRNLPTVFIPTPEDLSDAEFVQFLYRASAQDTLDIDRGPWFALGGGRVGMSVDFAAAQDEYCVTIEALRVRDGSVIALGEACLPHNLGEFAPWPEPFAACTVETGAPNPGAAGYRSTWCAANAEVCADEADSYPEACGNYAEVCGKPASSSDAGALGDPMPSDVTGRDDRGDADDDEGAAPADDEDLGTDGGERVRDVGRRTQVGSASSASGCSSLPVPGRTPGSAALLLLAAAWRMRRRTPAARD